MPWPEGTQETNETGCSEEEVTAEDTRPRRALEIVVIPPASVLSIVGNQVSSMI